MKWNSDQSLVTSLSNYIKLFILASTGSSMIGKLTHSTTITNGHQKIDAVPIWMNIKVLQKEGRDYELWLWSASDIKIEWKLIIITDWEILKSWFHLWPKVSVLATHHHPMADPQQYYLLENNLWGSSSVLCHILHQTLTSFLKLGHQ